MNIEEIIKTPQYSILLLKTYSILFLRGARPDFCARKMRMYFNKIKKLDMKPELIEKIKTRTCKPNWKGNKYSPKIHSHINPGFIYDELAINYLKKGVLKESDFSKLPDGYKTKTKKAKVEETEIKPKNTTKKEKKTVAKKES